MTSENHFVSIFKCSYSMLGFEEQKWYYNDNMNGNSILLDDIGFKYILNSSEFSLFIYIK